MFRTLLFHIAALSLCIGIAHAKPAEYAAHSAMTGQSAAHTPIAAVDHSLTDTARMIIRARTQSLGIHAPLTSASSIQDDEARVMIRARIAALHEADLFTRSVVEGLIAATGDATAHDSLRDDLISVIVENERLYFSALLDLLNHAAVAKTGWFATSLFGTETEHQAGALLVTARHDRAFLAAMQPRLEALTASGDVSTQTQATLARLLDQSQPASPLLGKATR